MSPGGGRPDRLPFAALWTISGSVAYDPRIRTEELLTALEPMLRQQDFGVVRASANELMLGAPETWGITHSWKTFAMFSRGSVCVTGSGTQPVLHYRLDFFSMFLLCLAATVMFAFLVHPIFGVIAFAWVYGMNRVIAASRVPAFFRSAIVEAGTNASARVA